MIKQIYIGAHIKRDDRGIIETMNNIKNINHNHIIGIKKINGLV